MTQRRVEVQVGEKIFTFYADLFPSGGFLPRLFLDAVPAHWDVARPFLDFDPDIFGIMTKRRVECQPWSTYQHAALWHAPAPQCTDTCKA